eukprot:5850577-Amphidinium_carterae.1
MDGNSYFSRPGPRLLQGCGLIAACIHGEEVAAILGCHKPLPSRLKSAHYSFHVAKWSMGPNQAETSSHCLNNLFPCSWDKPVYKK